jgi:hypothetical protein
MQEVLPSKVPKHEAKCRPKRYSHISHVIIPALLSSHHLRPELRETQAPHVSLWKLLLVEGPFLGGRLGNWMSY